MRKLPSFALGILGSAIAVFGQDLVRSAGVRTSFGVSLPSLNSVRISELVTGSLKQSRGDFIKDLSVESFGYASAPTGAGYEFVGGMSAGPLTEHGLECPRCIIRPSMERARYTLPPFGVIATLKRMDGRGELFAGMGGINAWKPDNTNIDGNPPFNFRRDRSFNDAWLVQGVAGAKFAVDKNQRVWLGAVGRYLQNYGQGKQHWNSFGGSATFLFGK